MYQYIVYLFVLGALESRGMRNMCIGSMLVLLINVILKLILLIIPNPLLAVNQILH